MESASSSAPLCPFCRIVRGEAPAEILYKDESVIAFRDTRPYALFPVGEYFRNAFMPGGVKPCTLPLVQGRVNGVPLRPPMGTGEDVQTHRNLVSRILSAACLRASHVWRRI